MAASEAENGFRRGAKTVMRYSIIAAVIVYPLVDALFYFGFFVALLAWLVTLIRRQNTLAIGKKPLIKPLLFLLAIGCLSAFFSFDLGSACRGIAKVLQALISFLIIIETFDEEERGRLLVFEGIVIVLLFVAGYGVLGSLLKFGGQRAVGFFTNPNILAVYLLLTVPLALALAFEKGYTRGQRFFFFSTFILGLWCMILTMTRGAWLGMAAALTVFALLKDKRLLILLVVVLLLISPFLPAKITKRANDIFEIDQGRRMIWQAVREMVADYPLLGVGIGNFKAAYSHYVPKGSHPHAHNLVLHFAATLGLAGLVFLIWIIVAILKIFWSLYRTTGKDERGYTLVLGLFSIFVGFMVHTLTHLGLHHRGTALLIMFYLAYLSYINNMSLPSQPLEKRKQYGHRPGIKNK